MYNQRYSYSKYEENIKLVNVLMLIIPYTIWVGACFYLAYGGIKLCRTAKVVREIPVEYTYFHHKCSTVVEEERRVREEMIKLRKNEC